MTWKLYVILFVRLWEPALGFPPRFISYRSGAGGPRGGVALAGQHPVHVHSPLRWDDHQQPLGAHCHTLLSQIPVSRTYTPHRWCHWPQNTATFWQNQRHLRRHNIVNYSCVFWNKIVFCKIILILTLKATVYITYDQDRQDTSYRRLYFS